MTTKPNDIFKLIDEFNIPSRNLTIPSNEIILLEGEIATHIYLIEKGCLRLFFNKDGKDITLQFFLENQMVSSFESFYLDTPSLFSIESIEDCYVQAIEKQDFTQLLTKDFKFNRYFTDILANRFVNYNKLFLSRIKDSPEERYIELFKETPTLIERIPHHYIASYLGITSVSLSRIRKRLSNN